MNPFEIEMAFEYNARKNTWCFLKLSKSQSWTRTTANDGNTTKFSQPTALQ